MLSAVAGRLVSGQVWALNMRYMKSPLLVLVFIKPAVDIMHSGGFQELNLPNSDLVLKLLWLTLHVY